MDKAKTIIRVLLGIMLVVFGLNGFLQFMPMPAMAPAAGELVGAFIKSGYIMAIVGVVEIAAGVMLLLKKYQPLALVILFPILLNAFLLHLFLDIGGIGGAALALGMNIFLMFANKDAYSELLKP